MLIVRGNFQEGNFGDDALLLAVQELVSRHLPPERVVFDGGIPAYRLGLKGYDLARTDRDIHSAKAILYGGGTQFFSMGSTPPCSPSVVSRVLHKLAHPGSVMDGFRFRLRMSRELSLPVLGVGLGFGPFVDNAAEEASVGNWASKMRFLWVRDPASAEFAAKYGCENTVAGPDLCFIGEFRDKHIKSTGERRAGRMIGIILRDWSHGSGPVSGAAQRWAKVASLCRADGFGVAFYAFSAKQDLVTIEQLRSLGEDVDVWDPSRMTVADYSARLDACDTFLTSRFHGAIFSMLLGKPFVAIGIEPKLEMVADLAGGREFLVAPDSDPAEVHAKLAGMADRLPEFSARVTSVREAQTRLAAEARRLFDARLPAVFEKPEETRCHAEF